MGRYAYHFTHIDNLPGLVKTGFLANNHPKFPKHHRSVAATGIQERRATMEVTCGPGGCVHDYVPLYFGSRSPMLLSVINKKNVDQFDILYFEFPITLMNNVDAVFCDASANTAVPPNFYDNPDDLTELNWNAIDSLKWGDVDETFRHQRMAELLIHGQLPLTAAARCVVWNDQVKNRVQGIVGKAPFPPVELESPGRRHWFTNFQRGETSSVVAGPREIALRFDAACKDIQAERGRHAAAAPFATLGELLSALRNNFGCLPQTAELVGLRSENAVHKETVDVHTKQVVENLLALDEYELLEDKPKLLVELAAFLHDIGKGPRSRWRDNGGVQKVSPNHPVDAMPMMVNILTRQVGSVSSASARILTKLVCYHDLVGDILGKGRDEGQLVAVAESEVELDMLFALGRADATALFEHWWDEDDAEALYDRCLAAM